MYFLQSILTGWLWPVLIMAFLTFCTANAFYGYAVHFIVLKIIMKLLINAVVFISGAGALIQEIYFGLPVTVNTPAHAEISKLVNLRHFLDVSMTGLASKFAHLHMLAMVEINVIRKVVNS